MDRSEQKRALRKQLVAQRLAMPDRMQRCELLQRVVRIWLVNRPDMAALQPGRSLLPNRGASERCRRPNVE